MYHCWKQQKIPRLCVKHSLGILSLIYHIFIIHLSSLFLSSAYQSYRCRLIHIYHFTRTFLILLRVGCVSKSSHTVYHMVSRHSEGCQNPADGRLMQIPWSWLIHTEPIPREWAARNIFSMAHASSSLPKRLSFSLDGMTRTWGWYISYP